LDGDRDRAIFFMFAAYGLHRSEVVTLALDEADLESQLIIPKNSHQTGIAKRNWAT